MNEQDRIYYVEVETTRAVRLIRAGTLTSARSFATRESVRCRLASQDDLIRATTAGVPVENIPDSAPKS